MIQKFLTYVILTAFKSEEWLLHPVCIKFARELQTEKKGPISLVNDPLFHLINYPNLQHCSGKNKATKYEMTLSFATFSFFMN